MAAEGRRGEGCSSWTLIWEGAVELVGAEECSEKPRLGAEAIYRWEGEELGRFG